jgi:transcriptional antiterminator RfaH
VDLHQRWLSGGYPSHYSMKRQEATWYACYTKPQKESLVHMLLTLQGFETLYLHYPKTINHARRVSHVIRSYFPRYIFVAVVEGQAVGDINNTIGVSTVVYQGDDPLEIPLSVIEELRLRADETGLLKVTPEETTEQRKRYRRGQKVRITEGVLEGLEAVMGLDAGHEVKVWMELFKGRVQVSLPPGAISPARRSLGKIP